MESDVENTYLQKEQDVSGSTEDGAGLALSGGGYRAMMFHVGALRRLNEVGLLGRLKRISSVSGGSITAAYLGLLWSRLQFGAGKTPHFDDFVEGVRRMAGKTVDVGAVIGGALLPGDVSDRVAAAYDDILFHGARLADLPDDSGGAAPRFVINATNIQSGALWRFSRPYMGDYRVGLVRNPDVPLAAAVAASSAFPPLLSPMTLEVAQPVEAVAGVDLNREPFTTRVVLGDGGVYDNLGLETVKSLTTLLVSDAGQKIEAEDRPHHDWVRHSIRVLNTVDNQVRSLRKRHLVRAYKSGEHTGAYWGIGSSFARFELPEDPLGCAGRDPGPLARTPTRLKKMPRDLQDRLMNWGYAICDAALRAHVDAALQAKLDIAISPPTAFPHPGAY